MGAVYPPQPAEKLRAEQHVTLTSPRRRYSVAARLLFSAMDLLYGRAGSLRKFRVLEIVARMPYQAWENVAYVAITHTSSEPDFARDIHDRVVTARAQQDNEQWHLLILEEMLQANSAKRTLLLDRLLPQIIAAVYFHVSWLLYTISPSWSYRLNADFEDHAEHEYMSWAEQNPELENEPWHSIFADGYGHHETVADLFRSIGHDERLHKLESERSISNARFGSSAASNG